MRLSIILLGISQIILWIIVATGFRKQNLLLAKLCRYLSAKLPGISTEDRAALKEVARRLETRP